MKPDFALSLSFDGIGLSLRGPEGWLRVGAVSLDVEDLDAELADLRRAALGLRPGGFLSKLVIPDEQIRYLELETGEADDRMRARMIRDALDGATPYAVEDLVYDWAVDGTTTQVAAVARETLEEAEAFALEHRFNPVSFVAAPARRGFSAEVFFGETASADEFLPHGARVERDAIPLRVVGDAPPPALEPFEDDGAESASSGAPVAEPEDAARDTPVEEGGGDDAASAPVRDDADQARPGGAGEAVGDAGDPAQPPMPSFRSARAASDETEKPAAPRLSSAPVAPAFSSVRARREPPLSARRAAHEAEDEGPPASESRAPGAEPPPEAEAQAAEPQTKETAAASLTDAPAAERAVPSDKGAAEGGRPDTLAAAAPSTPEGSETPAKPELPILGVAAAAPEAQDKTHQKITPPRAPGTPTPEALARRDMILRRIAGFDAGAADADAAGTAPDQSAPARRLDGLLGRGGRETPAPTAGKGEIGPRRDSADRLRAPVPPRPAGPAPDDEAARLTRFGERRMADTDRRGRPVGLLLTSAVLLLLLGIGAWTAMVGGDNLARLFPDRQEEEAIAAVPLDPGPETDAGADAEAGVGPATGPDRDPAAPDAPEAQPEPVAAAPEAPAPQPAPVDAGPAPLPEPEDRAPSTRALSPDEAAARYAATGIWQMAPERPEPEPFEGIEDLHIASVDGTVPQPDAVALSAPRTTSEQAPEAPVSPPPPGSVFDLDERGLVIARPEGALTPQGVRVFAGQPPVVPPSRAGVQARQEDAEAAAAAAEEAERRAALAGFRPVARPAPDLSPEDAPDDTGLVQGPDDELAGYRPLPRPDALREGLEGDAETAAQETVEAATNAAILAATTPDGAAARAAQTDAAPADAGPQAIDPGAGTPQAVRASLAPAARPGGFDRMVARAPEAPAPAAARSAPQNVQPSIPSNASVARAATEPNAINLRRVNLIGVYGDPSNRRALVRLSNGRYQKVEVGDRLDGGRISAIGEDQLRYVKNGRNLVLRMPQG
ncbi:hypothetical protein DRV85_00460 [Rhodosalinus halophilus]|uniref:Type IV pilus biogenesis protein PilP n=1 Tax=Rhodosalinus halophilus TaxID=2259333 RepID=A0A365UF19_9RHOB|nr:hypothetical protein [Rhodosalinus halophilus]RBI87443.1 hypothetical protein DRV85_00460 [Rhodosalinus halophilus]